MKLRKLVFWLHLVAGVVAGAIVLVMSVTGVLLAFERQITEWSEFRALPPHPGAARLSSETLLDKVRAALPGDAPSALTARSNPELPAEVSFGRERVVFVDPYTGAILGDGGKRLRELFHAVTDWHRWLGQDNEGRAVGRAITGACNLAFLFLVISGCYLWWPRKKTAGAFKAISVPNLLLRGKARDFNWHNAIGIWSAPILFFIVLTGVLMSYPWATGVLYRLTGNEPPPPRTAPGRSGGPQRESGRNRAGEAQWNGLDQLWPLAEQHMTGWQTISVQLAQSPTAPVTFSIRGSHRGRPDLMMQITCDPQAGGIVRSEPFSSYNRGRQLRTWARWVHTGEAGGIIGQLLAAVASAGAAVLVCTGFGLSLRRWFNRSRSSGAAPSPNVRPQTAVVEVARS